MQRDDERLANSSALTARERMPPVLQPLQPWPLLLDGRVVTGPPPEDVGGEGEPIPIIVNIFFQTLAR